MSKRDIFKNENILDNIYLERERYLLSVDDLLEDILERK